jgi:hypothetical protein
MSFLAVILRQRILRQAQDEEASVFLTLSLSKGEEHLRQEAERALIGQDKNKGVGWR